MDVDPNILAAFEAWYREEMPSLYRYVWYKVRHTPTAEELTAAICERALAILHKYDPQRGSLKAWIFGVAYNEVRSYLRDIARQPEPLPLAPDAVTSTGRPVEQALLRQQQMQALLLHMRGLSSRDQEIVALRYGAGFSNQEIAAMTGLAANNVGVILHRAIERLRHALQQEEDKRHA